MRRSQTRHSFSVLLVTAAALGALLPPGPAAAQTDGATVPPGTQWLPLAWRPPVLPAGSRELVSKATVLYVSENPSAYGEGMEGEVAFSVTLPLVEHIRDRGGETVAVTVEAGVFARFGLQITERELAASDWFFTVPVHWTGSPGWMRLRYYHTSSHRGDEYIRRYEDTGVHFARDGVDLLLLGHAASWLDVYGGGGFGVNVHPEGSGRWWFRSGAVVEPPRGPTQWQPTASLDLDFDLEAGYQAGVWLPELAGRRRLRLAVEFLTGPSPLGQFLPHRTTQFGIGLFASL
jgi:hypothetical protein